MYHWNNCWPYDKKVNIDAIIHKLNNELLSQYNVVLLNLEQPHQWSYEKQIALTEYVQQNLKTNNIYFPHIMRDPLNWIASYVFKYHPKNDIEIQERYEAIQEWLWDIWTADFQNWKSAELAIDYNQFVQFSDYRNDIASKLKLQWDKKLDHEALNTLWQHDEVPVPSSFDMQLVNSGQISPKDMKVLQRYQYIKCIWNQIPDSIQKISKAHWNIVC